MSVDPTSPIVYATAQSMYDMLVIEKDNDPNFFRTVFIEIPQVTNAPDACLELQEEYLVQVNEMGKKLQDTADMGNYLLNPNYPPAANYITYFSCANTVFVENCYP